IAGHGVSGVVDDVLGETPGGLLLLKTGALGSLDVQTHGAESRALERDAVVGGGARSHIDYGGVDQAAILRIDGGSHRGCAVIGRIDGVQLVADDEVRSEEHTSELQS